MKAGENIFIRIECQLFNHKLCYEVKGQLYDLNYRKNPSILTNVTVLHKNRMLNNTDIE